MTRKRHTEEQIIAVLKDAQAGTGIQELCRKHSISDATFYKWRAKYSGLEVSDVQRLRQLEDENQRLKQMVADQALDIQALKAINAKNWKGPRRSERRLSGAPSALGSVNDGCAGSWHSSARHSGIAAAAMTMRRCERGSARLPRPSGGTAVPGSISGYGARAGS